MRDPSLTLRVWAAYQALVGLTLLAVPNLLLAVLGIERTDEVWIRFVGALIIGLAYYNFAAARAGAVLVMRASVVVRVFVTLVVVAVVVLGLVGPILLLLGLVEVAAAAWTAYALGWPIGNEDRRSIARA